MSLDEISIEFEFQTARTSKTDLRQTFVFGTQIGDATWI